MTSAATGRTQSGDLDPQDSWAWHPSQPLVDRSRLLAAMSRWGLPDMSSMFARSVEDPEWFWRAVVDDLGVDFAVPFTAVVDMSTGRATPRWFVDGRLNVADLCAHRHGASHLHAKEAVVFEGDDGRRRALTYQELSHEVGSFAAKLRDLGVGKGDRVVLFLPVVPEAVVAFLACGMLGAISVPAFTGFGPDALTSRLNDSAAAVLITADTTTRRGKEIPLKSVADAAVASAPGVQHVVVVRHTGTPVDMVEGRDGYWDELPSPEAEVPTELVDANHPLTIIYTSGTSGRPKGIVHSHGGFAVKAATDFAYGFDIAEDDVIAWIADMGWMLGPLLIVGGLQLGATLVLTEGVPDHPNPQRLWDIARRNGVTVQGIAPTAARALMTTGATPVGSLDTIRSFASTGEAWDQPTWQWLFAEVGKGVRPIINYSGGTEVGGGILITYPFLPAAAAAFNGPLPGMDVSVLDSKGEDVAGEIGELCVRNVWPGMTHAFWRDRDRYLQTYWSRWDDIWVHGDLARADVDGSWRVLGRSDDTIKVSGRRVGPSELEAAILVDPRVAEVAVIGVPDVNRGQSVVAFVVTRGGVDADDLVATAEKNVGRAFAPEVHLVSGLPKTKNGKIVRRVIRAQHLDEDAGDISSLDPGTPLEAIPRRRPSMSQR